MRKYIIDSTQKKNWKEKGFTVIRNVFDNSLIQQCRIAIEKKYNLITPPHADFGSINGEFEFPSNTIFDSITLHPDIINAASDLLETNDILLTQSDAWSKLGSGSGSGRVDESGNRDQRIHMDYGNHSFLHVADWDYPEVVACIIYLSDTSITGGGTAVVPKNPTTEKFYQMPYINMPGQHGYTFKNDKSSAEDYFLKNHPEVYEFRKKLYEHEIIIDAKPGDVLFYRLDLWHRGTPVKKNKIRHVVNLAFKKKECYWINTWNKSFTKGMYYGRIEKLISSLTPRQCSVIGIPPVGDPIWTRQRIENMKARYPHFNIQPYLSKL